MLWQTIHSAESQYAFYNWHQQQCNNSPCSEPFCRNNHHLYTKFFHTHHSANRYFLLLNCPFFSGWCFTHQYKNTTQFCFYADLAATQNTNQKNTAPKNHASTANTYGLGSASAYGHVKLSDSYTNSAGAASNGVAASSKAIVDCRNNIMSDIENTYAGISATLNSSVCSSGNIWGCRSGRVVMITFYLQLTGTFKTYTSYKIGTLSKQIDDVDMRSIAMDQDTGHAHIISCTAGSKDLTLDLKGETPLKAGNWIWGQITAFTHQK